MAEIQELIEGFHRSPSEGRYAQIVEALRQTRPLWAAQSRHTGNLYLGEEQGGTAAYLFSKEDYCAQFIRGMAERGEAMAARRLEGDAGALAEDCRRCAVRRLVVDSGQVFLNLSAEDLSPAPDSLPEPEETRQVRNPELVRAMHRLFQAAGRRQASRALEVEMFRQLVKGRFLAPIRWEAGAGGETPRIVRTDGKRHIPVFTDWTELRRFDRQGRCRGMIIGFDRLERLAEHWDGVVINPMGAALVLTPERLRAARAGVQKIQRVEQPKEAPSRRDTLVLGTPDPWPEALVQAVSACFRRHKRVRRAYLKKLLRNGEERYLLAVALGEEDPEAVYRAAAQEAARAAQPHLGGTPLEVIPANSPLGVQAVQGTQPFYRRRFWGLF